MNMQFPFFSPVVQKEEVRFASIKEFQKWYANEIVSKSDESGFINVPLKIDQGEYMVVRPCNVIAIRVQPVYLGSVERF